jgi:hypothetical protein
VKDEGDKDMTEDQQERAKRAVQRALAHLGDAADALTAADRASGNHEFLNMANRVGTIHGWVRDIAEEMR